MKKTNTYRQNYAHSDHLDENELAQYIEYLRRETDHVPEELIHHVESCSHCRAEIMAMTDMMDALPDVEESPALYQTAKQGPPVVRQQPILFKIVRTAAAVAALIMVAWGLKYLFTGNPMNDPASSNRRSDSMLASKKAGLKKAANGDFQLAADGRVLSDTTLYADAFACNPVYENMIAAKYRKDKDLRVAGPEVGSTLAPGDSLHISWKTGPANQLEFLIVDNRERIVYAVNNRSIHEINWKIDLKPGLYYWKLVGQNEVWKISKFIIHDQQGYPKQ